MTVVDPASPARTTSALRDAAGSNPEPIRQDVVAGGDAELILCARCQRRPGTHPRWRSGAETALVCGDCHAQALEQAAAWTPAQDTHIGIWRCWAVGCTWAMSWSASWVGVCGELPRRIARDAIREHAEDLDDEQHHGIARDLGLLRQVLPSEIGEL